MFAVPERQLVPAVFVRRYNMQRKVNKKKTYLFAQNLFFNLNKLMKINSQQAIKLSNITKKYY